MKARYEIDMDFSPSSETSDEAFRVLVLGNLTGRRSGGQGPVAELSSQPLLAADIDTFDDLLARLCPRLTLSLPGGQTAEVAFRSLEDFHPDELWARLPLFEDFAALRRRLLEPSTAPAAMEEIRRRTSTALGVPSPEPPACVSSEADADTVERLLGKRPEAPRQPPAGQTPGIDLTTFFRQAVSAQLTPEADADLPTYLRALDDAIGERMRALLHHPAFQEVEALWRSIHNLVTGLELGEELQLFLLDVTVEELANDLLAPDRALEDTELFRLLVERHGPSAPGGGPWSALVGDFYFGPDPEDLQLLEALGALAARAGGPFLAGAKPTVLGCTTPLGCAEPRAWQPLSVDGEKRWADLRRSPTASWVGVALPRVLLRLPYGSATDEVDGLAFEELTSAREHGEYLWGNPAFLCAQLLATAFQERGWAMEPGDCLEVGGLPAHTFTESGESHLQPCAEVLLPERAAQEMLLRGVMPMLSYPNRNAVRLARFQSLASPAAGLAGPWRRR